MIVTPCYRRVEHTMAVVRYLYSFLMPYLHDINIRQHGQKEKTWQISLPRFLANLFVGYYLALISAIRFAAAFSHFFMVLACAFL